jgi:broad specificity phosphatase PhoE
MEIVNRFVRSTVGMAAFVTLFLVAHAASLLAQGSLPSTANPRLVVLVRHAEKAAGPTQDPPLTEAGGKRAEALRDVLAAVSVTAIVTSEFRRTRETAAAVAAAQNVTIESVPAAGAAAGEHVRRVVEAIRKHSGVVLVVGHSNTIPAIIAALGGPRMRDICDPDYDNLFLLTPGSGKMDVVAARYGAEDGIELTSPTCAAMGG